MLYLLLENWTKLTTTLEEVLLNHRCPLKYTRLIDIADDASKHLSGDSITDALESLHKESNMKEQLKKVQICFSTALVKLQGLFQDPEENKGSRTLCKKIKPLSELSWQQPKQHLQSTQQHQEGQLPTKHQLETRET